jgi:RES domain-containing protein
LIVWRISNFADLSGEGGKRAGGRWHSAGAPIVYLASSPAAALLEVLVHLESDIDLLPATYQLLEVTLPASIKILALHEKRLTEDWLNDSAQTRAIGDAWLASSSSAAIWVPSAVAPCTNNLLLNPRHSDASKATVKSHGRYPFDPRLLR